MDARELTDAQFNRAVEIIQSLPKTGPIQTGYEEKLTMYSLYKQATVGNVQGPRPGIWDMLGRAKWDAWAKHKDLDPYEAKWLYVEALLKVLRRYSDATVARDLVRELESYGDASGMVMSGTSFSHAVDSDSSSENDEGASHSIYRSAQYPVRPGMPPAPPPNRSDNEDSSSEEEEEEQAARVASLPQQTLPGRSSSAHSTPHNYRTPVGGPLMMTPAQGQSVPASQPHPGFETPSAFAGPSSAAGPPSSLSGSAYGAPPPMSPPYAPMQAYRRPPSAPGAGMPVRSHPLDNTFVRPRSAMALERAVEGVQAHLAALSERLDALEAHALRSSGGMISPRAGGSGPLASGQSSPYAHRGGNGIDDLGLWSYVVRLLLSCVRSARSTFAYLLSSEGRSPALIIVRRLFLDLSFILAVLGLVRAGWRKSGVRRREIAHALRVLWKAVVGQEVPRALVSRGV